MRLAFLKPAHIDISDGYRYYLVEQLPKLNRILALKGLRLSLEQIANLLSDKLSSDELQGMLKLKEAQLETDLTTTELQLLRARDARKICGKRA